MADRGAESLLATVGALRARVQELEQRVAALEHGRRRAVPAASEDDAREPAVPALPRGGLGLAGRTLLVLAGAYLVRALVDAGALPLPAGVALGLAYAAFWLLRADRDARRGDHTGAALHAITASAIAFSLIWETAARFSLLGSRAAGGLVLGATLLGLAVAFRHRLTASAWLTTLAACVTTLGLLVASHDPVAALVTLLALAALLEWLAFRDAWLGLRWCVAATLDFVAVLIVAIGTRPVLPASYPGFERAHAALVLLALPLLYVTSVAARTLRRGCPVKLFEVLQGTVAVGLGFVGAARVLAAHGQASRLPALLAVALAVLCYAVAFAHAERRVGQGRNFYFYTTAGGLLMLGGTLELGVSTWLPLAWSALGLVAVSLGRLFDRTTLRAHGSLYLLAAALASGLLASGVRALVGVPGSLASWPAAAAAAFAVSAWGVLAGERQAAPAGARLPRLLLALVVALTLAAAAQLMLQAALGERLADEAGRAVAGSAVLVALVLGLAWLAARGQPELSRLVYPLVAVGALKLLLQDVRAGRPATLVASLALYGALLLLLPRLLRSGERPSDVAGEGLGQGPGEPRG